MTGTTTIYSHPDGHEVTVSNGLQPNQALALMQQAQAAIKVAAKKRMANTSAQPSK